MTITRVSRRNDNQGERKQYSSMVVTTLRKKINIFSIFLLRDLLQKKKK